MEALKEKSHRKPNIKNRVGEEVEEAVVGFALEKAQEEKIAHGEIETEHVGYLGAQDTFYVGVTKGVGRIYQQTFIDTYSAVAFAKLYTTKQPINAADLLNDRVLPFFEERGVYMYCASLLIEGQSTVGELTRTTISCIWRQTTLTTRRPRRRVRRPTGSVSDYTRRCWMSFIGWRLGRRSIAVWKSCNRS